MQIKRKCATLSKLDDIYNFSTELIAATKLVA
jgi:hypothetical protein